ncbi:Exocyst subunit EXO70 family protein [Rhynchospora pubera]|uniref:Exocyst subunit Exo70 family protein n=1 Tax=Rhynchospora pubera TaxID=906938 RepID=A0AAV8HSJ4_9POAL|nr:Exocyst subunit EXO70 family protein [Rhynchospora pubera]
MYGVLRELEPKMKLMLKGKACEGMLESTLTLVKKLAETALETFITYPEVVKNDADYIAVLDGTIHPFTRRVMNCFFSCYKSTTLKQLFQEFRTNRDEPNSQLLTVAEQMMEALQYNLDKKAKQFNDKALRNIFLMNNFRFMVTFIVGSEAKELPIEDWAKTYQKMVFKKFQDYRHEAWSEILRVISPEGDGSKVSQAAIKDKFKSFNYKMKNLYVDQRQWFVDDIELRKSLKSTLKEDILPIYRTFLADFETKLKDKKHKKYTEEDVEIMMRELFEGKPPLPKSL